jgi:predicted TIM-barrel fold metal-dependent hydrolase
MREVRGAADIGSINPQMLADPEPNLAGLTIVSVDDHVVEPPDLFEGRMPKSLEDRTPFVVELKNGAHAWYLDGALETTIGLSAIAGRPRDQWNRDPARFTEMRPGCWRIDDRIKDMNINGIDASVCFPNSLLGFGGGRTLRMRDQELALAVMRAYNDWYYEEWYSRYPDRIIPCQITWMRDVERAAAEVEANAGRGFHAVTFSEDPGKLGLPSLWTRYWDPFFRVCEETGTAVCLHVGTSGWNPGTYPPNVDTAVTSLVMPVVYFPTVSQISVTEWMWSGIPARFPNLKIVMSEGGAGWVPALASRSDYVLEHSVGGREREAWQDELLPSEVLRRNFYFCTLDEPISPEVVEAVGVDHLLVESDYPHADGTWPHTQERLYSRLSWMSDEDIQKVTFRNAAGVFHLDPDRLMAQGVANAAATASTA